jgi:hypothetical protein
MSKPGNTITISGVVTDKRVVDGENIVTCSVVAKDEQGDVKVSGSFDAALPSKA